MQEKKEEVKMERSAQIQLDIYIDLTENYQKTHVHVI